MVQLTPKLTANVTPTGTAIEVAPNSATYEVSAKHGAEGAAFQLDVNTFVDDQSRLHVQRNGLKTGDVITVTGTATYVNPTGDTTEHKAECAFTVK